MGHERAVRSPGARRSADAPRRPAAAAHPALRLQALAGNRAVAGLVALQREDARLRWNATGPDGSRQDAESPGVGVVLPYKGAKGTDSWDWEKILKNLAQVDADGATTSDEHRCGPASVVAQAIPYGPSATATAALKVAAAAKKDPNGHLKRATAQDRADWAARPAQVELGARSIQAGTGTYGDLWAIADLMMIYLTSSGETGSSTDAEVEAMGELMEGDESSSARSDCPDSGAELEDILTNRLSKGESYSVLVNSGSEPKWKKGKGDHWITVAKRSDAESESKALYVYDPWPRAGDQVVYRSANSDAFNAYFYSDATLTDVKYASFSVKKT